MALDYDANNHIIDILADIREEMRGISSSSVSLAACYHETLLNAFAVEYQRCLLCDVGRKDERVRCQVPQGALR